MPQEASDASPSDERERFLPTFMAEQHRLFRFIASLVPGHSDAEELFQETALVLWRRWSEFDPGRPFTPWACGIALNLIRNWRRKQTRRGPVLSIEMIEQLAKVRVQDADRWDRLHAALATCLEKLPAEQRALLDECYGRGVSIKVAADHANRSPNVVYKLLAKIRQMLHDCVRAQVGGDAPFGLSAEGTT